MRLRSSPETHDFDAYLTWPDLDHVGTRCDVGSVPSHPVMLLPKAVLTVVLAYQGLQTSLGTHARTVAKHLQLCASPDGPAPFLPLEVAPRLELPPSAVDDAPVWMGPL